MIEIESHTADIRIRLEANTLENLYQEGMKSMYSVLQPKGKNEKIKFDKSIKLTGSDKTILFIDFLNEVLSYSLINKCIYNNVISFRIFDDGLKIHLSGYKVNSFLKDIKAVTFHEAEIIKSKKGVFETRIILDI
ncbi:MAG: archease [Promethearchaeota archaeon]|jgi:SHS2 domain-containing protein